MVYPIRNGTLKALSYQLELWFLYTSDIWHFLIRETLEKLSELHFQVRKKLLKRRIGSYQVLA